MLVSSVFSINNIIYKVSTNGCALLLKICRRLVLMKNKYFDKKILVKLVQTIFSMCKGTWLLKWRIHNNAITKKKL